MTHEELKKVMLLTEKSQTLYRAENRLQENRDEVRSLQFKIENVKYLIGEIGEIEEEDKTRFNEIDKLMDQVRSLMIEQEKKVNRKHLRAEYELENILEEGE